MMTLHSYRAGSASLSNDAVADKNRFRESGNNSILCMRLFLVILMAFTMQSCEDVIELELDSAEPRVVIDAAINVFPDGSQENRIRITRTTDFYEVETEAIETAIVRVIDQDGTQYDFDHISGGFYGTTDTSFSIMPDTEYTLEAIVESELYTATEELVTAVPLTGVEQESDAGFSGEDRQFKVFFSDPGGVANYYFFTYEYNGGSFFEVLEDEFFDGSDIFTLFFLEDTDAGEDVTVTLYGVDEQYYQYGFTLANQLNQDGPFETQPATVRGNIVNASKPEDFPFGYFRISEAYPFTFTVED